MDQEGKRNSEERRKRTFRRIFIGFMTVTAVLTFFSKSLYNYRLPVVTVALPKQGKLDFPVEGTAAISLSEYRTCYADKNGRIVSSEWNASLLVSEEEAENVKIGNKAVIKLLDENLYLEGEVKDVIPYNRADFAGKQVIIQFHCENALINGQRAYITIKNHSVLYDTLIPAAALRKDTKGYYVFSLQEDDGILGNGYKAWKVSVDLLDSDGSYCAVQGLPEGVPVIVEATSEISEKAPVYYEGGALED